VNYNLLFFGLIIAHWNILRLQFCEALVGSGNVEVFCEIEGCDSDEYEE
jgi:hypothetical protein